MTMTATSSLRRKFDKQWKLLVAEQEASLGGAANSKPPRLLAHSKSSDCPDVSAQAPVSFCIFTARRSTPSPGFVYLWHGRYTYVI